MNIANKITITRILLTPIFIALFLIRGNIALTYAAVAVFLLAALTDKLDGFIARKYGLVTTLGKFLDPLADKLLVISALICMVQMSLLSAVVVIIIVARELIVTSFRIVAMGVGVEIAADRWGKIKTVAQMVSVIFIMLEFIVTGGAVIGGMLMWGAAAITIFSGANYLYVNRAVFKD